VHATAGYDSATSLIELSVRLPETPAYRLDLLQEIREFGPELVGEEEAVILLHAFSAYSVGEYQVVIDLLEGHESLSALTLLAQARLFSDDLRGSREAYDLALQKPQPDEAYTEKLYMGAALALWRPESYYLLYFAGNKDDCKEAGKYYAQAEDWAETDNLAHNIRIVYAGYCFTEGDPTVPGEQEYAAWKDEAPRSEPDLKAKDADYINATEQYILAFRQGSDEEATRNEYKNRLLAAQSLLLARAALSEFYWNVEENCTESRTWLEEFRSGIVSNIEKEKLRRLLQAQPLFCR
ncbi:MAG TPA: hypothetical protein VJ821_03330, partial [Anaerolineales bacterium]|nr:hypothetical protein [Anaerolineales bacterium]